jgi:hypothetical protein
MTIVQPATFVVKARFFQGTIAIRPHLWLKWAKLAIRQEQRAKEARFAGSTTTLRYAFAHGQEVEESIQAIAAVRHCLHNLWRVWRDYVNVEPAVRGETRTHEREATGQNSRSFHNRPAPRSASVDGEGNSIDRTER